MSDRLVARRHRCAQCHAPFPAACLDAAGLCECCQLQPELDLGLPPRVPEPAGDGDGVA
jgi:hypothetical protein